MARTVPLPTPARGDAGASLETRVRRWLKPPRKLKTTREGKVFLLLTFGVGIAAINTGNNLLYLLLGMLLSLIIVSGVMSELSLRNLRVTRRLPARAQVGRPHLVEIDVRNDKRRVPSYAIEIEDLRAGQPADKRCFFLKVGPQSSQVAAYRRTPQRRGRDRYVGFRVATRFPFGLFEKSREIGLDGELVIYPAVDALTLPPRPAGHRQGGAPAVGRGGGDEIVGIRPLREGDDPRDTYWRKSTIEGQHVLRERAVETQPDVELELEVRRPTHAGEDWVATFERRIRELASRAVAHVKRGDAVALRTTAGDRVRVDHNVGADPLLRLLALVEPVAGDPSAPPPVPARAPRASFPAPGARA